MAKSSIPWSKSEGWSILEKCHLIVDETWLQVTLQLNKQLNADLLLSKYANNMSIPVKI